VVSFDLTAAIMRDRSDSVMVSTMRTHYFITIRMPGVPTWLTHFVL